MLLFPAIVPELKDEDQIDEGEVRRQICLSEKKRGLTEQTDAQGVVSLT